MLNKLVYFTCPSFIPWRCCTLNKYRYTICDNFYMLILKYYPLRYQAFKSDKPSYILAIPMGKYLKHTESTRYCLNFMSSSILSHFCWNFLTKFDSLSVWVKQWKSQDSQSLGQESSLEFHKYKAVVWLQHSVLIFQSYLFYTYNHSHTSHHLQKYHSRNMGTKLFNQRK